MSYYAVELSNWYKLDSDGPLDLSNIAISHTFTGTVDEAWFYLVPLAIEAAGAPAIKGLVDAQQAILDKDHTALVSALYTISNATEGLTALLKRMYEKCDADIFFNRFRHYSRGSKNSQDVPNGVFYQGVTEMDEFVNLETPNPKGLIGTWRKYAGASAGQSPLIHTLDVGLDIHHVPMHGTLNESNPSFSTDSKSSLPARFPSKPHYVNPMLEMRESLSQDHQNFLRALGNGPSIRAHIASLSGDDNTAVVQFNRAVDNIKQFRDAHISLTAMYIVLQAKKAAAAAGESSSRVCVGTGGTDLVPFLKQTRDETVNALILLP
ncbi:tryptophan 2,3- dioxygenase, variant 2 [Batrachochytrium dendrobatidis]|nr:tryptophan 2,3- dioxygenase, variant 2 [Batrachochytrium dendrobatidis]